MSLTREAIVKALHDKGAYCGVCDYETALDGTPGCSECQQVLDGYADAILALTTTVDRDTIARALFTWDTDEHPAPRPTWDGLTTEQRDVWRSGADAVTAVLNGGVRP